MPLFEQLMQQEPGNKIAKTALVNCLAPIIREHIEKKYFTLARLRLKQLKKLTPNSKETADLDKLLESKEKAVKTST